MEFRKLSIKDYPKKLCAVLTAPGCNFRCPYCPHVDLIHHYIPMEKTPFTRSLYWRWVKFPEVSGRTAASRSFFYPASSGYFWDDEDIKWETKKAMKEKKAFKPVIYLNKRYKNR